jgi:hypothetical protein
MQWVESGHSSAMNRLVGKFGFEVIDTGDTRQPPEGYATATVYLGEHWETLNFWLKLWSPADYVRHWHEAAEALLDGEAPVLFCTDYTTIICSCFVGWPDDGGFVFEEWAIKHENLNREGLRLSYVRSDGHPHADVSHFHVPTDYVEAFVRSDT